MSLQTAQIESTPLHRASGLPVAEPSASALLGEAKLLERGTQTRNGSTHAESAPSTFDALHAHYLFTATLTTGETRRSVRRQRTRPLREEQAPAEDHLDRSNNERIELLARQYVAKDKLSSEEQARLAIVTERVRQLLPAVTVAEFEALEKNLEASRQVSNKLTDLRTRIARLRQKRG
jgi:hypothetical protein